MALASFRYVGDSFGGGGLLLYHLKKYFHFSVTVFSSVLLLLSACTQQSQDTSPINENEDAKIEAPVNSDTPDTTLPSATNQTPVDEAAPDNTAPASVIVALKNQTRATLTWNAPGNNGTDGTAAHYELKHSAMPITNENEFASATPVIGVPRPLVAGTAQEMTLTEMTMGNYFFALRAYDDANNASPITSSKVAIAARVTEVAESLATRVANDHMAKSMAGNCDINKDGLSDLIVGAPNDDGPNETFDIGKGYVILGKVGDTPGVVGTDPREADIVINGIDSNVVNLSDFFGASVSCGDFNGDGVSDIAVGAPYEDTVDGTVAALNSGAVYLFYGSSALATGQTISARDANVVFQGVVANYIFGYSISFVGDIDKDNKDELAIVAPAAMSVNSGEGIVYIFSDKGTALVYPDDARIIVRGEAASNIRKVVPAGDVNGDGFLDLAFSTIVPTSPANNAGKVYVLFGRDRYTTRSLSLARDADIVFTGANVDYLGGLSGYDPAFSLKGDLNGDSIKDVVIAAPYADANGVDSGKVYVFYGRGVWERTPSFTTADITIVGSAGDRFGFIVDSGGDFNNDGRDDLLITSPLFDNGIVADRGGAFIYYGHNSWSAQRRFSDADIKISRSDGFLQNVGITPTANSDYWGYSAVFMGDSDGDGYGDVAIGSPNADIGSSVDVGGVFIIQ